MTGAAPDPGRVVRLTGTGTATGLGGIVLLGAGFAAGYPTLVGVGATGIALVLVAIAIVFVPARLVVDRTVGPERVTVGAGATGRIDVRNAGRLPSVRFEAVDLVDGEPLRVAVPALPRDGYVRLTYPVPTPRRGVLRIGPVQVERRDPLGLVRRGERLAAPARLWVHPRIRPLKPLPVGVTLDFEGRLTNARRGSTAFASLRGYQPGDDPRQIHWRSTARVGALVVQDRVDTSEPTATVLVDTRPAVLDAARFEEAVEVAASVLVATSRAGQQVSLLALGEDAAAVLRSGGRGPLDRLAALRRTGRGDTAGLVALARRAPAGGCLVLVTGVDPAIVPRLAAERRRYSRVVVVQLGDVPDGPTITTRSGLAVVRAGTAADAASAYSRLAGGRR